MLIVVGKVGCAKCIELKDHLTDKGIEFTYKIFEGLDRGERKYYAYIIRAENNGHFPLVLDEEGNVIDELWVKP